ncbi:hypothetical protein T440DRAFT_512373 [Plenodomus tracheiphilus IPT5]|uniref:Uncharacterized protein n=1 Tax=Plenodomus tracheiphilus IPT5 TaxID=1408161 RepID=A0A6A7APW4_9PLEO|nr:hypothetical protein T440DRAFT_512373 [Plenodomus tracheiphilus IPT5]
MESIVSKVHVELVELAATYADASIRIKDLKQSKGLKNEIEELFKDEYPTKPAWPYLDQLIKQDRCFAELGCRFKHGAALYKSPLCEEHFVCKNHQSSPCLAKHLLGQRAKRIAVEVENLSAEHLVRGDLGKNMSGNEKSDETNAGKRLLDKEDLKVKRPPEAIAKETVGKEELAQDSHHPLEDDLSYDQGSSSSDKSEWDDNVVTGEGMNWQNAAVGR